MIASGAFARTRRAAGVVKRLAFPKPEVAAWRRACRRAAGVSRYTAGTIKLGPYELRYTDLLTLCPQWQQIFVNESLSFRTSNASPRVLDCGANVGLATLYFKKLYPLARITAFEADPAICSILTQNLRANQAADVEVVGAAVWTSNATVAFHMEGADSGAIVTDRMGPRLPTADVPSVRLRDILATDQVDLLKIDIEGAERDVLEDCHDVLDKVQAIQLDLHEFDPRKRNTARVLELLDRAGFVYAFDDLYPLPGREPVATSTSLFPGRPLCWAVLVRAWRL